MKRVALYGAGRMGRGLAHVFAWAGWQVDLIDAKARADEDTASLLVEAQTEIDQSLGLMSGFSGLDANQTRKISDRVRYLPRRQMIEPLASANLVMEGVPETQSAKEEALSEIAKANRDGIIASTTSTMLSTELARFVERPERFLNAHWLNPAYLIPLVEVSPHDGTTEDVTDKLLGWLKEMGKEPVRCTASPGFIVPRIQALAMNEAARMVEEGVASAEDIDRAIRAGFGPRFAILGLIEFIDWGGVDILHHASRYMTSATGEDRFAAPAIIGHLMADGKAGMNAGQGFADFRDVDVDAYRMQRLKEFHDLLSHRGLTAPPVL
jgi:3-hydroxybutyryl-CoA dehydrogenase